MLLAFQSVIMLMILTRVTDLADAGIFTIAYANASLFLTVGKYGMRTFHVSDARQQFSFAEYCSSRQVTVVLMLAVSAVYVIYAGVRSQYSLYKGLVMFFMCVFKAADAIEDVFTALYQQSNRLDVGAKVTTVRVGVTIVFFAVCLIVLRDLLLSLLLATVLTYVLFILFVKWANELFADQVRLPKGFAAANRARAKTLLKICFPLFVSAFLSFYIGNAPKYAIDANLNDELQACYGFISMPVAVVGMLNNFVFFPVIFAMTQFWKDHKLAAFLKRFTLQLLIITIISLVCLAGAALLGIPVLSWLYHTDLHGYGRELLVLMLGGGLLGLSGLLTTVITIIRCQKQISWAYAAVSLLALIFSTPIVRHYEIMGASVLYTVLMGLLCAGLAGIFIIGVAREKRMLAGNGVNGSES